VEHSLLPSRHAIKELDAMQITLNGQSHEVAEATTISELLVQLGVQTRHVAVEVNLEIMPQPEHPSYVLQEGDQLEVVTLVGGG
jgi:sulfur carrier protein